MTAIMTLILWLKGTSYIDVIKAIDSTQTLQKVGTRDRPWAHSWGTFRGKNYPTKAGTKLSSAWCL